jgi:heat-inducible transcriptional repressor
VHTTRPYTEIELQRVTALVNQRYAGQSLSAIRTAVVNAMQQDKASIDAYMQASLDLASKTFATADNSADTDYVVAGESQLVSSDDIHSVQNLLQAFASKKDILELVDRSIRAEGVQIFIGQEAGYEVLGGFSLVTAPYQLDGENLGVLGVIGPTRMAYEQVIPIVDVTAQMLSQALKNQ